MKIPLHAPKLKGKEIRYLKECVKSTWLSSSGKFVRLFEKKIENYTKTKFAIGCINGTSALQVSLNLAGVRSGHEVIVPTVTFIAPINAVKYNGADPIFMDCDDYCNLDINKTVEFIKKQTYYYKNNSYNKKNNKKITALIAVHIFGHLVNLEPLINLCKRRNIKIIEDASESLGSKYISGKLKGKHAGTAGFIGCLSFNLNKIITSGGGGMMLTNNKKLAIKIRYLLNQAKDDAVNFVHNNIGYNFALTNLHAATGYAQFEKFHKILSMKKRIHEEYKNLLMKNEDIILINSPKYSASNYWINYVRLIGKKRSKKNKLLKELIFNNIEARPIWKCNHLQKPFIRQQVYKITKAPKLVNSCLCLPSSYFLKKANVKRIANILGK